MRVGCRHGAGGWQGLFFGLLVLGLNCAAGASSLESLRKALATHISQPRFSGAIWGVKVVSVKDGRTWFEHNADTLLIPASNAKLFTGALALDRLGADFRFETTLHANGPLSRAGTLRGDLIVRGRGDPTFAARFNEGDYRQSLLPVYRALKEAGVKRITGAIIGDEGFFHGPPLGADWAWDDLQEYYGAATSALTVDDNVIDVTILPGKQEGAPCRILGKPETELLEYVNRTTTGGPDSERRVRLYRPVGGNRVLVEGMLPLGGDPHIDAVAAPDPAALFVEQLERLLEERGIRVSGRSRIVGGRARVPEFSDLGDLREIGVVASRPFGEILPVMMKRSQNLYAQLFLLQVGELAFRSGALEEGDVDPVFRVASQSAGLAELARFLSETGIPERDVMLREGSGLSRACLIKPRAVVALLRAMRQHENAGVYMASLPVAGRDGTLRRRMRGTQAEGNVRAKTGTLRHVHSLSGYVDTADGEPLAFAIMLNHFRHPDPEGSARSELDRIAVMLAEFRGMPK